MQTHIAPVPPPYTPVRFAFVLDPASYKDITPAQLAAAIPDLYKQQTDHVGPFYGFPSCTFYSQVFDETNLPPYSDTILVKLSPTLPVKDALGYHDDTGHPCIYIETAGQSVDDITVTISHELCEERGDPFCNTYAFGVGMPVVNIAYELCDQCEDQTYRIGSTLVSDFVLPANFNSQTIQGAPVTFCNTLPGPGAITDGGYVVYADGSSRPPMDKLPARKLHWNSRMMRRLSAAHPMPDTQR